MIIRIKHVVALAALLLFFNFTEAQKKTTTKKTTTTRKTTFVAKERNYSNSSDCNSITDVNETDPAYLSVKNLVEQNSVKLFFEDNTFRGKEPLKRGDFIVTFNSALDAIARAKANEGVDTSVVNTYDINRGGKYLTDVAQVKDLKESSVYYPAAKSLIEKWGIAAPFTVGKMLNANSRMTEKEVYNILRVTLGYRSAGINPYAGAITRQKFAIVLNNAVTQKLEQIHSMHLEAQIRREAERRYQQSIISTQDSLRRDSTSVEIQQRKAAALQREIEARQRLDSTRRQ
ncbi:hypothetical protein BH09BAC2_BH09BAC2_14870 [soil metagenome]